MTAVRQRRRRFVAMVLFLVPALLFADDRPTLAVYPLANPSGDPRMESLGNAIVDTVYLSLALMGSYRVVRPVDEGPAFDADADALRQNAMERGYDDLIYGATTRADGEYAITVYVYDLLKNEITLREEVTFFSVLDSFDAADELTVALVDGISGVKVTYGTLVVSALRPEPFRTEIDGIDMGAGFPGLDRIVAGPHHLVFYQDRGDGEKEVAETTVDVPADAPITVAPPIPWLSASEAARFREIDGEIIAAGNDKDRLERTEALFDEAIAVASSPFLAAHRPALAERYGAWREEYATALPETEPPAGSGNLAGRFNLGREIMRDMASTSFLLVQTQLTGRATTITGVHSAEFQEIAFIPEASISLDGKKDDWVNVPTTAADGVGDHAKFSSESDEGADIIWGGVAIHNDRIYFAVETADHEYTGHKHYYVDGLGVNIARIGWDTSGPWTYNGYVPDRDWNRAQWPSGTSEMAQCSIGEIMEFSFPLSTFENRVKSQTGQASIVLSIQTNDHAEIHWQKLDEMSFEIVFPRDYELLRGDTQ